MKFVGVREFKQDVVKYLNGGNEIVVMKRKKPIARLTPVPKDSAEIILLEIGRVLAEPESQKTKPSKPWTVPGGKSMAKIVIDANVIISAAFGGKPLDAVVRALEDHEVYVSETIERELQGVIFGLSKKLSKDQILFVREKIQQLVSLANHIFHFN